MSTFDFRHYEPEVQYFIHKLLDFNPRALKVQKTKNIDIAVIWY